MANKKVTDAIAATLAALGKTDEVVGVVSEEAVKVAEFIGSLAKSKGVDIASIMDGDPEVDRALLQAADVEAALNSGIDWANLGAEVLEQAFNIVKMTAAVAAILV